MTDFRPIAIIQGIVCMAGVIAAGIATHNHWAWMAAILSLGLGFASTTCVTIDKELYWAANILTACSILAGAFAIMALL